jgi:hypothetical protein
MMVYSNDVDNVNTGNTLKLLSVRRFSVASSTIGIDSVPTIQYRIMYYVLYTIPFFITAATSLLCAAVQYSMALLCY